MHKVAAGRYSSQSFCLGLTYPLTADTKVLFALSANPLVWGLLVAARTCFVPKLSLFHRPVTQK